jgi:outer membrane receptor protein involved in Fe transport
MNRVVKRALYVAVSLAAISQTQAWAADAAAPAAPVTDTNSATQVQAVIVTAQKREQDPINVPITLTAYTGAFLDKIGVQDVHDLSLHTPGFFLQNQSVNDPGLVMRGITTDSTDPTQEPRVSIYLDGVSISQIDAASVELFDLERVEVAKGPQTTLFGRAALTGAVNIIENKATETGFDWSLHAEGGNYNYGLIEGMVNIPLGDSFAVRIAGRDKVRDGYIDDVLGGPALNGTSTKAARISFNYHPNKSFNDDFILNYEHDDPSAVDFKNTTFYPSNPTTGQVLGNLNPYSSAALGTTSVLDNGKPYGIQREIQSATNILSWTINRDLKFTSTSAARHYESLEIYDPDGFSFPLLTGSDEGRGTEFSQDFRLNYDPGGRFSMFGGISAFSDYGKEISALQSGEPLFLSLLTGVLNRTNPTAGPTAAYTNAAVETAELQGLAKAYGVAVPTAEAAAIANNLSLNHIETETITSQTLSYDAYVDGTFKATDKLEFSGGVRFTADNKSTFNSEYVNSSSVLGGFIGALSEPAAIRNALLAGLSYPGVNNLAVSKAIGLPIFGILYQPTAGNGLKDKASLNDNGFSWRATARYAFDKNLDVYATYARGRRPEVLADDGASAPYGPTKFSVEPSETLDDYEGGVKSRWFDKKLSLNGAIYYNEYHNFSTTAVVNNQFVTVNAGNATTYGFEGDATWAVTPMDDIFATYTYTHGRYDNGIYKGNQFRLTPPDVITLGASLRYRALGGVFDLVPNVRWQDKQYFNPDNGNPTIQKEEGLFVPPLQFGQSQNGYAVADLRLTYTPDRAHWTLGAFVTNLTDTKFLKDDGNTGLEIGLPTVIPGEPRFYGVSFTLRK